MYNPNRDLALAIGQGLNAGIDAYDQTKDKLSQLQRQKVLDDREAQKFAQAQAENTFKGALATMQNQMANGDYAGAAKTRQQLMPAFNQAYGLNLPNTAINGTTKTVTAPAARPTSGFQGPMPLVSHQEQTFEAKPTLDALWATPGLERPKAPAPEYFNLSPGQSRYRVGPDGRAVPVASMPGATPRPTVLSQGAVAVGPDGHVIATGAPKTFAPPRASGGRGGSGGAPRLVPDYGPDGTVTYVPAAPGVKVHTRPAKPAAPKPAKPFDEGKAARDAKTLIPDPSGMERSLGAPPPAIQAKRDAYVAKKKAEHDAASGGSDDDAAFSAWVQDKLKKKGRR